MNMNTADKVQVGDSTTGTSTSTTWHCPYTQPRAEQGWECPRCGRINAPWVRQCDCSRNDKWDITWHKDDYTKPWWYDYKVTCAPETTCDAPSSICGSDSTTSVKSNPNSTIYTTIHNPLVGGSDYKVGDTYVNVGGTQSNKVNPNSVTTAWNCTNPNNCHTPHYTTETVVSDGIHNFYNLKTPKETK